MGHQIPPVFQLQPIPQTNYPLAAHQSQWNLPPYLNRSLSTTLYRGQPLELIPVGQRYPLAESDFSVTNMICGIAKWIFGYSCEENTPKKQMKELHIDPSIKTQRYGVITDLMNSSICEEIPDPECPTNMTYTYGEQQNCIGQRRYEDFNDPEDQEFFFFWEIEPIPSNDVIPTDEQKQCILDTFNSWVNQDQHTTDISGVPFFWCMSQTNYPGDPISCLGASGDYGVPILCNPKENQNPYQRYDQDGDTRTLILSTGSNDIRLKVAFQYYDLSHDYESFGIWNSECEDAITDQLNMMFGNSLCFRSYVSTVLVCLSDDHFTTTTTTTTTTESIIPTTTTTTLATTTTMSLTVDNTTQAAGDIPTEIAFPLNIANIVLSSLVIIGSTILCIKRRQLRNQN